MAQKMPRSAKIALASLGVVVGLSLAAVGGLNFYVRTAYGQFYQQAQPQFPIPGTNEGFVVQDLDYLDGDQLWLFSGYRETEPGSPVYKRTADGGVTKFFVALPDGSVYDGHGGGISSTGDYVYLTCEGGYLVLDAQAVAQVADGGSVPVLDRCDLEFTPAFLNVEGNAMYVGEFYYPEAYETSSTHHITTPDGTENPAVLYVYPAAADRYGFADQAASVLSIPAKVQGACRAPGGNLVLSTSWGIGASHFYEYDAAALEQDGVFFADGRVLCRWARRAAVLPGWALFGARL